MRIVQKHDASQYSTDDGIANVGLVSVGIWTPEIL